MWKSMHDLGTIGTLYFHELPVNWPRHGVVNYEKSFYYELIKRCQYEVIIEPTPASHAHFGDTPDQEMLYISYVKTVEMKFMSLAEFSEMPGLISQFDRYRHDRDIIMRIGKTFELQFQVDMRIVKPEVTARSFCIFYLSADVKHEEELCFQMLYTQLKIFDEEIKANTFHAGTFILEIS